MRINLLHNKIVMDTVTNKFIESFKSVLVPMLEERFGALDSVTVYEDYLSDGFLTDGTFRLPLTVTNADGAKRVFCSWRVDRRNFEDMIPYSYKGSSPIEFKIEEGGYSGLLARLEGRALLPREGAIQLNIDAASRDKTFLSGKYSQSFVDLMAYEITRAIEKEFAISGAADSSLELHLSFAPGTFMEHTSESVSYRRLRISARSCAPRDLWIKWTRLDGAGTYTVGDHVGEDSISFEIASDVPQKIREKEYRYLMTTESPDAYRAAMSRKNFTEWRELVKRVIKRGEVSPLEEEKSEAPAVAQEETPISVSDVFDIALSAQDTEPIKTEEAAVQSLDLRALLDSYTGDKAEENEEEEEEINPDLQALLLSVINRQNGAAEAPVSNVEDGISSEIDEEPPFDTDDGALDALSILTELGASSDDVLEAEAAEEETEDDSREDPEQISESFVSEAPKEEPAPVITMDDFGYDERRREELNELCRERDELREALDALKVLMKAKDEEILKLRESLAERDSYADELKTELAMVKDELAAKRREEEREKDRIASMARIAVESYVPAFEDVPDSADLEREAEEKRLKEEREEQERLMRERAEAERLAKEKEEEERRIKEEAEAKAELERKAAARSVRYVSKTADIFFRYPVDPNITKKIQDIIVSTVKYFEKEDVYMKIKATIPESKMVKLEFLEIPEGELALLTDIIRVLGHSKLGITRVLLD